MSKRFQIAKMEDPQKPIYISIIKKGVFYRPSTPNIFEVEIYFNKQSIIVGTSPNKDDAMRAFDYYMILYYGLNNVTNKLL
jgi:hypothetical protein